MVVPPQRDGGQSQYIQQPELQHGGTSLAELTDWMLDHLGDDHSVERLARRALMSERTFARRFRSELGESPAAWLNRQRLLHAQQLLEESDAPVEEVARVCGFGSAATLRHHFTRALGTTPQAYRRAFGVRVAP